MVVKAPLWGKRGFLEKMILQLSSWPEVDEYLTQHSAILIPIGSTEQHGPTGLIGTDALCPEVIAQRVSGATGLMVGPTFNVGIAPHHMGFAGTMSLRPSTMKAVMHDWVSSLAQHGFDRIYFLNGHGGNVSTIRESFEELHQDPILSQPTGNRRAVVCKLANWWGFEPVLDFCRSTYGAAHGAHATPSEVAITYAAYPEHQKQAELTPQIAPMSRYVDAQDYRAKFPDGRMGSDPSLATVEDGERLIELSAENVGVDFKAFSQS
ncbi:MAG: creatininase family protein [Parvibaculaceae bacterium]|nr:creatininase family protein [Parvibaculaceae bacterium]